MSTVVIKDLPDSLHAQLKERARRNHRSMTKEVVHLIESGLGHNAGAQLQPAAPGQGRNRPSQGSQPQAKGVAAHPSINSESALDGREALRAALNKQPDGSYVNVLGIEDASFFETLDRIRAETLLPDVGDMFDEAT